jgi:Tol biopolymer transport system component
VTGRCVRTARRGLLAALLIFGSFQTACVAGRMTLEELPEQPIAFIHWADKAGQKRGEIFASAAEIPPLPPDEDDPEGLQELQIRAHLRGDETLVLRSKLAKYPGRLMLLWPRTGEIERIDSAPLDSLPLAWSPDRERLLIASAHRGGKEQLYEYHRLKRVLSPVTVGPLEHSRGAYDAQGRIVVHQSERVSDRGASRTTVHRLLRGSRLGPALAEGVPPGPLHVLPDGDRIVYEQIRPRPRRNGPTVFESLIAIRSLGPGGEEERLIKGREPTLTPDGQWIVFASQSTAGYRLRRMRLDGTSRVAIGPGGAEERMPSVSPDGEFIVFVQFSGGRRRLVARRYDGKDERVLLPSGWSEFPVW